MRPFLSSNAQDFIEEHPQAQGRRAHPFLSSNAQDFIEDRCSNCPDVTEAPFLSSNAQDFIEESSMALSSFDAFTLHS